MVFGGEEEAVGHIASELTFIEWRGIAGGLAPYTAAAENGGEAANALEDAEADAADGFELAGDARVDEEEVHNEVVAPCAARHSAFEAAGEPLGRDGEVKLEFAVRIGGDHAAQVHQLAEPEM